jgi:hypothetical protein
LFISTLDKPARAILNCLAQGKPLQQVAVAQGLCRTTIQNRKERLAQVVREFMGTRVLVEAQQQPQWMDGLRADREHALCRLERAGGSAA